MIFVAKDILTGETVGPFKSEDDAYDFLLKASDHLDPQGGAAFDIQVLWEPESWFWNNTPEVEEEINGNEEGGDTVSNSSSRSLEEASS